MEIIGQILLFMLLLKLGNDPFFRTRDQIRVIATLAQFHHGVHEVGNVRVARAPFRQELEIPLQNGTVVLEKGRGREVESRK